MLSASTLHDALRSEGLVPPEEDVHLLACSNRWRHALERIEDRDLSDSAQLDELRAEVECADEREREAEHEKKDALRELAKCEDALTELEAASVKLEGERDRALERAVELEAELAKLKGNP